ncbi:MAG: hypothetical protein U0441_38780 [Polyangiaceae bacterium]
MPSRISRTWTAPVSLSTPITAPTEPTALPPQPISAAIVSVRSALGLRKESTRAS